MKTKKIEKDQTEKPKTQRQKTKKDQTHKPMKTKNREIKPKRSFKQNTNHEDKNNKLERSNPGGSGGD